MVRMKCINQSFRMSLMLAVVFILGITAYPFGVGVHSAVVEPEDPFDGIHGIRLQNGEVVEEFFEELPDEAFSAFSEGTFEPKGGGDAVVDRPPEKFHPKLKGVLATRSNDGALEKVIITFKEDDEIPRFPQPDTDQSRYAEVNLRARARAAQLVDSIKQRRAARYEALEHDLRRLGEEGEVEITYTSWLVPSMAARLSRAALRHLAERDDVLYIEPEIDGSPPPADSNPDNDVIDGRARMTSDPYFNLGLNGGFIGLLDTGLRFTHTLFNSPSHVSLRYDCVNGGGVCITSGPSYNPNDDCWNHGTSSAAIITGNSNLGSAFRGVTAITLDSFKVYPNNCGGLNTTAVLRAFERSVAVLDRVIVAEMQGGGSDTSSISLAADAAFNAGAVVIAANGNNGPGAGTVNTPANAHKVIGVGAIDVVTGAQQGYQSRGPAPDGRYKPDIQAPTNAETASSSSNTALRAFGGTSGATPFAAGAAALLRNWLRGSSTNIDPGQVYAHLILSGQSPAFNHQVGAGQLSLPVNGFVWRGKTSVTNGATIDIPLSISGTSYDRFDVALWWPETATQSHNDVDVHLLDPSGVVRASSVSIPSIFERARFSGAVATGTWKLRIRGYSVSGSQTVYWAAHVRDL